MKQISLRLNDDQYNDLKELSSIYSKSYSLLIRESIDEVIARLKNDPWYKVQQMMNATEIMDEEEESEILQELNTMSKEDKKIVETRLRKI